AVGIWLRISYIRCTPLGGVTGVTPSGSLALGSIRRLSQAAQPSQLPSDQPEKSLTQRSRLSRGNWPQPFSPTHTAASFLGSVSRLFQVSSDTRSSVALMPACFQVLSMSWKASTVDRKSVV